jgi:hypothetical protein
MPHNTFWYFFLWFSNQHSFGRKRGISYKCLAGHETGAWLLSDVEHRRPLSSNQSCESRVGVYVVEWTSVAGQRLTMTSSRPQARIFKWLSIHAVNAILNIVFGCAKANSHIPCRSHAVPLRVWIVSFPFVCTVRPCLIHTCHAVPIPFPCHATTMPFWKRPLKATAQRGMRAAWEWHGMCELASTSHRRHVGDLPAFGFFWLPRGDPRSLLPEAD